MISKVAIRNFKSLRDVQIDLERFTIFVGPNASGKSSILQALEALCQVFGVVQPTTGIAENYILQVRSRGAEHLSELTIEADGRAYRYRPYLRPANGGTGAQIIHSRETASSLDTADWKEWAPDSLISLPHSVPLRLELSKLLQPTPAADASIIAPDGAGLHTALMNMALFDPDSWQKLQGDLKQIIPIIRRIRHSKASQIGGPHPLLFDTLGADNVPASQMSEGALFVLGWMAAIYLAGRPSLILLDDLDRALHPRAQKDLITLLRGLLDSIPDLQILATTHSPYLLDHMKPCEVRMTALKEDGSTICAPLVNHPKFEKWKEEMTPGEMWSFFGEKWMLGTEVAK